MTMRVKVENTDSSGRIAEVVQEDRPMDSSSWSQSDKITLRQGEFREFYIHAARRLTITENPNA